MVLVGFRIHAGCFRSPQYCKDNYTVVSAGLDIAEQSVLLADYNGTDGIFRQFVADFNFIMVEKSAKVLPLVQGVSNSFFSLPAGRKMISNHA